MANEQPQSPQMKRNPAAENELRSGNAHHDAAQNVVTPVVRFEPAVALAIVQALGGIVRAAHAQDLVRPLSEGRLKRAQVFEEGHVYLLEPPFEGFFADRYLMDFYDSRERDLCSRMHIHTGLRFVRMMTGPGTAIRVSSFSPLVIADAVGWSGDELRQFEDLEPTLRGRSARARYNVVVPENSWVDMQIPRGVSHQFNADGPNAVIDSVHPEESLETLREGMSEYKMMAQTIFLASANPAGSTCALDDTQ